MTDMQERAAQYHDDLADEQDRWAHHYLHENRDSLGRRHPARASARQCRAEAEQHRKHAAALRALKPAPNPTDLVSREAVIRAIRRRFDARKPVPTGSASRDKINRDFAHECYTACVEAIEALPAQPSAVADPDLHAALEMSPCHCKGNFVCARCGALRLARFAQPSAVETRPRRGHLCGMCEGEPECSCPKPDRRWLS